MEVKLDKVDLTKKIDEGQLKRFEEDAVWQAFKVEVEARIEIIRNEMEAGSVVIQIEGKSKAIPLTQEGLIRRQGECASCRFILSLPEILKEGWKQDEQAKKRKKEE